MNARGLASLIADALLDGKVISETDFGKTEEIIEEEIVVREALRDVKLVPEDDD